MTAIEQGLTIREARIAYRITNEKSIREWLRQYKSEKVEICEGNAALMAKKKNAALPDSDLEKEALKKALQEAELKIKALNTLIDAAEDQLKVAIRKKSGAKPSPK